MYECRGSYFIMDFSACSFDTIFQLCSLVKHFPLSSTAKFRVIWFMVFWIAIGHVLDGIFVNRIALSFQRLWIILIFVFVMKFSNECLAVVHPGEISSLKS